MKDNPVHVIVEPSEIRGYALSNRSDFMPEDIQTLNKGCVRFKSGYIPGESEIREAMDRAMIMQFNESKWIAEHGKQIIRDLSDIQRVQRCTQ